MTNKNVFNQVKLNRQAPKNYIDKHLYESQCTCLELLERQGFILNYVILHYNSQSYIGIYGIFIL